MGTLRGLREKTFGVPPLFTFHDITLGTRLYLILIHCQAESPLRLSLNTYFCPDLQHERTFSPEAVLLTANASFVTADLLLGI
jgi:hypothetical protein